MDGVLHHQKSKTYLEEICKNYTDINHIWGAEADLLYSFIHQILCTHTAKFTSVAYFATCQSLSNICIMTYYCQIPSGLPTNTLYAGQSGFSLIPSIKLLRVWLTCADVDFFRLIQTFLCMQCHQSTSICPGQYVLGNTFNWWNLDMTTYSYTQFFTWIVGRRYILPGYSLAAYFTSMATMRAKFTHCHEYAACFTVAARVMVLLVGGRQMDWT